MSATHPTAFVFAGGGSLGAIQVGALRELVAAGVRPDFLVGASVGAINACFFASWPDSEGVAALEAIWRGLKRSDIFPVTLSSALGLVRGKGGLFETHGLRQVVERSLRIRDLEDAAIPVHVVATDLNGAAVRLSRGPAVEAVLASAAIPIAFPSVQIGNDHLIDGAIAGNTPILTAAELGAKRIIVLQTGYACSLEAPPTGAVARGMHALTLLISNQMERDLKLIQGGVDVHVAPHLCPLDVSPFNFDQSVALIERAARQTRAWIEAGGLAAPAPDDVLDHKHAAMAVGPALAGYDPVSYFGGGDPVPGTADFAITHGGRDYWFANATHRDAFQADPERYLPQYGGWCAYAMARGVEVRADPLSYEVVDHKLYLNRDRTIHDKWKRQAERLIAASDRHWRARRSEGRPS